MISVGALFVVVIAVSVIAWVWAIRDVRSPETIALVGALIAIAAAGRLVLAPLPGVELVTPVVVMTAIAMGARRAAIVGMGAMVVSNTILGHGPWTFWQMTGMAIVAISAAGLFRFVGSTSAQRGVCVAIAGIATIAFDAVLIASQPYALGLDGLTLDTWVRLAALGGSISALHVVSVMAFTWLLCTPVFDALTRARRRLVWTIE